ncbi:amino acid ABC transporter permease [Longispora albida]|uniref:amino acid ABC transporter permease n=1 Tax=Longispora albida TaxID=203523 RepID=UPI000376DC7E|nr:amino acid ABC transporter permease [Longispora albida]
MKNQQASVLYDAPGPRAKRVTLIGSIVVLAAVVAGLYYFVYLPLERNGQFTEEKWGPLLIPGYEFEGVDAFALVWQRIWEGAQMTLLAAVLAIVVSVAAGTALAIARVQLGGLRSRRFSTLLGNPVVTTVDSPNATPTRLRGVEAGGLRGLVWTGNALLRGYVEIARGLPVVITIFFVARFGPTVGLNLEPLWYLVIGLGIYNSVVIAEILRSGMAGLPGGQAEAASALGLSTFQTTRIILLPQAFKVMLPALISQLVVVLKDTSLGFIISYEDLLNVGKQIVGTLGNPIQVYTVIAVMFITANYALSKLAQYVQHRLATGKKTKDVAAAAPTVVETGVDGTGPI